MSETATDNQASAVFSEYKGNPMVSFKLGEDDRFPFQFGKSKAEKLILYIEQHGAEAFLDTLKKLSK